MRLTVAPLLALLALAGCGGGTVYYAEGVDVPTRDADAATCELQALREFPVRNQTRYTPRVYVPPQRICNSEGACVVRPARFDGGERYTVDVNASGRQSATRGCMASRGYARVGLPACEQGTQVRLSTVMPALTGGTCLYSPGPGPALVVNPA